MLPTAHQVRELCTDLKFISKIGEDEKVHVGTQSLQNANSWFTAFIRMITSESKQITLKYIKERTDRAIEFCEQLYDHRHDPDAKDLLDMLREDLEDCVTSGKKRGLEELQKTYSSKHKSTAEIEEIIRFVRLRLDRYNNVIGPTKKLSHYKPPPPPAQMSDDMSS